MCSCLRQTYQLSWPVDKLHFYYLADGRDHQLDDIIVDNQEAAEYFYPPKYTYAD